MSKNSRAAAYLLVGAFTMLFLGFFMLWSIFTPYIMTSLNCSKTDATNVYTFFLAFFCLGAVLCGLANGGRYPRRSLLCCAVFISGGYMMCSQSYTFAMFFAGYSVLNGIGVGFAYNAILAAVVPWFLGRSGFATGVLFMGYGLCGTLFSLPAAYILEVMDWRHVFLMLSACSAGALMSASFILRPVAPMQKELGTDDADSLSPVQMIKTKSFILYFIWVVLLLAGGMILNGSAASCSVEAGMSLKMAAGSTSVLSFSGALSRIVIGEIYDRKGYRFSMIMIHTVYSLGCLMLLCGMNFEYLLLFIAYSLIGFSYGSLPTISSPFVLTFYGKKYYSQNFSVLGLYTFFSSMCGPFLFGAALQKFDGSFSHAIWLIPVLGAAAFIAVAIFLLTRQKPKVNINAAP